MEVAEKVLTLFENLDTPVQMLFILCATAYLIANKIKIGKKKNVSKTDEERKEGDRQDE